ncbi:hypothetical protein Q4Q35_17195 [Flavivirga aquimarina]|uniref:Uncharacterized protein n=1 Tax=Flavivirga aquimarina TaxID=2027862 RepID=A0ABT8WEQ6_9FLAO|nr:hypothetical protein [Flavivirga aquimarina]MDO5971542.1 hypothetical protein [Flavivirga aquimarina]
MKLKFTILLFFISLGIYAQKEVQPYTYTVFDKNDENPQTILIYASAKSVNSVKFTLKNSMNEVLKIKEGQDAVFEVFPFTEIIFREKFAKNISSVVNAIEDNDEEKEELSNFNILAEDIKDNTNPQTRGKAIKNFRNVYQFFNALIITAFQYDTEPVAGVLKYKDTVEVTKKIIEGLDTDVYFNRQTKLIREIVFNSEKNGKNRKTNISQKGYKYNYLESNGFIEFLGNENTTDVNTIIFSKGSLLWALYEFNQNTRKRKGHSAKSIFKHYTRKQLQEWYNIYALSHFVNTDFVTSYFDLIKSKDSFNSRIKFLNDTIKKEAAYKKKIEDSIKSKIKDIKYFNQRIYEGSEYLKDIIDADEVKYGKRRIRYFVEQKRELISIQKEKSDSLKIINGRILKFKTELDEIKNNPKEIQNEINFLIANHKDEIVKVPIWNFEIENIEIDFNDGFIEHITCTGKIITPNIDEIAILNAITKKKQKEYSGANLKKIIVDFYKEPYVIEILEKVLAKEFKFENEYPIGFSSKTDFADLDNYSLYAFEGSEKVFSLPLTNVISLYVQRHQNDRLDFSPKDQVIRLPLDDLNENNEIELKKEKSSKILNAKIFTDFNGLKESEPNGLVQVEVEKQIPLWTKRMNLGLGRSSNIGFANYVDFNLTWAKLNEEDRELQVSYAESFTNNELQVDKFVTYLDLIKFENVSVGVDLNAASFDFPLIKTRIELNAGVHYGKIKVVDTLTNTDGSPRTSLLDKDVNMIRLYPDAILRIRPEERFGGYLRFRPFKTIVPNNETFFSISSIKDFEKDRSLTKSWLHRYELGLFYTPSIDSDNKFFFRYRYTNTSQWETNGYSEVQLGYLIYLKF